MQVLVFEPRWIGHSLAYVRHLVTGLRDLGLRPTVALCASAPASLEYATHLAGLQDVADIRPCIPDGPDGRFLESLRLLSVLRNLVRDLQPDRVLIPWADRLAPFGAWSSLRGWPRKDSATLSDVLVHRAPWAYPSPGPAHFLLRRALLRSLRSAPWHRMLMTDPLALEAVRRLAPDLASRVQPSAEPVAPFDSTDKTQARTRLSLPPDGRLVATVGGQDRRKGTLDLARAFSEARLPGTDRLLLAGRLSPEVREALTRDFRPLLDSGRLILRDGYLSEEDLRAAVVAADLVCTAHCGHIGTSGTVTIAAAANRPVLAPDYGWFARIIPAYDLGSVCRVSDREAFSRAMEAAMAAPPRTEPSARTREFTSFHTIANFQAIWTAPLREALGLPRQELPRLAGIES